MHLLPLVLALFLLNGSAAQQTQEPTDVRTLTMPREEHFVDVVREWAGGDATDCGVHNRRTPEMTAVIKCVTDALANRRAFALVVVDWGIDSWFGTALASDGKGFPQLFSYGTGDTTGSREPFRSHISQTDCRHLRFRDEGDFLSQECDPPPTRGDFRAAILAAAGSEPVDCRGYPIYYSVERGQQVLDCVQEALAEGRSFMLRFSANWIGDLIVDGALAWDASDRPATLLYYIPGNAIELDAPHGPMIIRRQCPVPRLRAVQPLSSRWRTNGSDSSVEVDCGVDYRE